MKTWIYLLLATAIGLPLSLLIDQFIHNGCLSLLNGGIFALASYTIVYLIFERKWWWKE